MKVWILELSGEHGRQTIGVFDSFDDADKALKNARTILSEFDLYYGEYAIGIQGRTVGVEPAKWNLITSLRSVCLGE